MAPQNKTAAQKLKEAMASDPWISDDVQIDWSGVPSMQGLPQGETFIDGRFSPLANSPDEYEMRGGDRPQGLRAFVEHETARATAPNKVNLGKNVEGTIAHDGTQYTCTYTVAGKTYQSRGQTYEDAAMAACRFVFNYQPDIRKLDENEMRVIAWLAQSGKTVEAMEKYLELSCPGANESDLFREAKYAPVLDAAVWTAWSYSHDDYSLADKEFPRYLKRFAKNKRFTLALVDSAWEAYKAEAAAAQRSALLNPQPQPEPQLTQQDIAEGLEEMSDAQLYDTMKRFVRSQAGR